MSAASGRRGDRRKRSESDIFICPWTTPATFALGSRYP